MHWSYPKGCSRSLSWCYYRPEMTETAELCVGATFSQHSKQQKVTQTIPQLFCASESPLCACWWALHQFLLAQWANGTARPAFWYKRWVYASHVIRLFQNQPGMAVFVRLMTAWLREKHDYVHSCNHYASMLLSTRAGESKGNVRWQAKSSHLLTQGKAVRQW